MRKEYDFSQAKRGAVLPSSGKSQVTLMLDDDLLEHFRSEAEAQGTGYQSMINAALRSVVTRRDDSDCPITASALRQILREELRAH